MKHEKTTYNTKLMLANSLKKAMLTKPFSKITVSELIADCGLNRKTFYYHFEDIYSLLKWMFELEAIEVVRQFDLLADYKEAILFVMNYTKENKHLISCAYDSLGRDGMKHFFYADFYGIVSSVIDAAQRRLTIEIEPSLKEYAAKFYTEAISGMLIDWVQNQNLYDARQIASYLSTIIETALNSLEQFVIGKS